jgi:D-glycero-alpha-D-manno-heptose 1-phosphate guanylyltransferase
VFDTSVDEAIVLAGGMGTRLRSVVSDVPKPMAPIGNRPFLEYLLNYWIDQGIRRFTLSVGYRHEAIANRLGSYYRGAQVRYAIENTPLGTGGALFQSLELFRISAPVLLLNGDTYFAVELAALTEFARTTDADVVLSLFKTDEPGRYMGLKTDAHGRVLQLQCHDGSPCLANGGVYWLRPETIKRRSTTTPPPPQSLEHDVLPALLNAGNRLYGRAFAGTFIDIGVPGDYLRAQQLLSSSRNLDNESR